MRAYKISFYADGVLLYSDEVMLTPEQKKALEAEQNVVIKG